MKLNYNEQILKVTESEIRKFNDYARANNAEYYLTLGEPDFYTPEVIVEATEKAMNEHKTKYGPTPGNLSLRKKICEFENKFNNVNYNPEEVIITQGSTEAITSALFTILNPDDEVIIPIPAYPMYREIVTYQKAKVVTLDTSNNNFQISKEMINSVITDKTKCIILTSPNNPTGTILSDESLNNIHNAIKDKGIFVICDDVYNQIVYTERKPGFVRFQDMKDRIVVCQSYSKSYAMPGWRCGYMLASEEFIFHAKKIHQYMIVALNTFIQDGMEVALDIDNQYMIDSYKERRDYVYNRLVNMGLDVVLPDGAFYIFPSIEKLGISSMDFCKRLVKDYKVAIIPGFCFEQDKYIRISYCVAMDVIKIACDKIEKFVNVLKKKKKYNF